MPFVAGFLFILQICFVIHVLKTGRETFWIGIIMMLPGIGCAAYFFTRILPGLNQSHTVNKAGKSENSNLSGPILSRIAASLQPNVLMLTWLARPLGY